MWQAGWSQAKSVPAADRAPKGWTLPLKNDLAWSKDGKRLFFGFKPPQAGADAIAAKNEKKDAAPDPYDFDAILAKVEGDVWHWNDPRIIPQQKMLWEREKDRDLPRRAARGQRQGRARSPASTCPTSPSPRTRALALATSDLPYLKQTTWGEGARDVFVVDLADGRAHAGGQAAARPAVALARRPVRGLLRRRAVEAVRHDGEDHPRAHRRRSA